MRAGLLRLQEGRCFYCARAVASAAEVDHFLPWSRHPDNALHNLVVADLAQGLDWEAGSERILGTARAVYAQVPEDGRLWEAPRTFVAPDRSALAQALA